MARHHISGAARHSPASGFTLIEVLVSLTVLAFGLLGVAAMQVNALRNTQSAHARSVALFLAYDIIDRIHSNRYSCVQGTALPSSGVSGFPGDCYDLVSVPSNYGSSQPSNTCFGTGAACTAQSLAMADLWTWQQSVAAQLPQGEGVVCNDNTPNDGMPSWYQSGASATKNAALYGCDGAAVAAKPCATCVAVPPVLTVKIWWDDRLANSTAGASGAADASYTYRRLYLSFEP